MTEGILDHVALSLVETTDDAIAFREFIRKPRRILGVDTETTGLSPDRDSVRLIQFGDLNEGWSIPWDRWSGIAVEVLDNYQGHMVFHNSKFDIRHIQSMLGRSVTRWPWERTNDTMGMAHILDSQRMKGLKPLAARYVDAKAVAAQRSLDEGMRDNKWTWETVPIDFPPYWQYAAMDPVLTCYLYEKFADEVLQNYRELYDLEMGATRVAARMEELGIRVDLPYAAQKSRQLTGYADEARAYLDSAWGIVNPTPMQLVKFFNANDIPLIDKFTASGAQSMDKHVLETTDHVVAETVLKIRKAEKLAGTYLDNFPKFADAAGYIHPNINTMAARTGRMSITEPALQTLPRKDPVVRDAFISRDGNSFLTIDADQIEARLTAHFSRDPGLIAAFQAEGDFFCNIATPMFGYEIVKGMAERDLTKGVVYGKVYGASVTKMAETAGVPESQMAITNAAFDTNFPGVRRMAQDIVQVGKNRKAETGKAFVVTPYGRHLVADSGKEYTLVNYLIQCHASEILKKKMVLLDAALPPEALMILPIHDEIMFDVPSESVVEIRNLAESVLNESAEYAVPMTWGGDIMPRAWGDKYHAGYKSI